MKTYKVLIDLDTELGMPTASEMTLDQLEALFDEYANCKNFYPEILDGAEYGYDFYFICVYMCRNRNHRHFGRR